MTDIVGLFIGRY